jgi:hypothetical protein
VGVVLLAVLGVSCGPGKPPLEQRAGSAVSTSARVHIGGSVSIGVIDIARYDGHEPAVFDQVVPNEHVEGVRVLGYRVVTDPGEGIRSADGFPPKGFEAEPVQGFTLRPGAGPVQIVVGLTLTHEGVHHTQGFTLRYHVGSARYEQRFDEAVSVCSFGFNAC